MSRLIWISAALLFLLRFTIGRPCPKGDKLNTFKGTCHLCIDSKKVKLEAGGESHCYQRTHSLCMDKSDLSPLGSKSSPCKSRWRKILCTCPAAMITSLEGVKSTIGDPYSRLGSKRSSRSVGSKGKRKPKKTRETGGYESEWKPLAAADKKTTIPKGKSRSTGKTTGRSKGEMIPERKPKRRHGDYEPVAADKKTTIPKGKSRLKGKTTGRSKGKPRSKRKPKKSKGKEEKPSTAAEFEQCVIDNMGDETDPLFKMGFYYGARYNAETKQYMTDEYYQDTADTFKSGLETCDPPRFVPGEKYAYIIINVGGTDEIRYIGDKACMDITDRRMAADPGLLHRASEGEDTVTMGHASLISAEEDKEFSRFMRDPNNYGEHKYVTKIRWGGHFKVANTPNEHDDQCIVWWDNGSGHFRRNSKWGPLIRSVFGFQGRFRPWHGSDKPEVVAKVDYLNYFLDGDFDREFDDRVGFANPNDGRYEKDLGYEDGNFWYWNGFLIGTAAIVCTVLVFLIGLACGMLGCWGYKRSCGYKGKEERSRVLQEENNL